MIVYFQLVVVVFSIGTLFRDFNSLFEVVQWLVEWCAPVYFVILKVSNLLSLRRNTIDLFRSDTSCFVKYLAVLKYFTVLKWCSVE